MVSPRTWPHTTEGEVIILIICHTIFLLNPENGRKLEDTLIVTKMNAVDIQAFIAAMLFTAGVLSVGTVLYMRDHSDQQ